MTKLLNYVTLLALHSDAGKHNVSLVFITEQAGNIYNEGSVMTQAHKLKTWPEPFAETWAGRKTFEYRNDDRNYQVGDVLELAEYDPKTREYTGRQVTAAVTYILRGPAWGVPEGMCIMSLSLALAKG